MTNFEIAHIQYARNFTRRKIVTNVDRSVKKIVCIFDAVAHTSFNFELSYVTSSYHCLRLDYNALEPLFISLTSICSLTSD